MSRIKIRVSAGVFEVALVRVIEETKSIEVLWDRGIKREFKWGSVLFGSSDGQSVVQKPSEPAPLSLRECHVCYKVIRYNRIIAIPPTTHVPYNPPPAASSSTPSTSLTPPIYLPSHIPPHPVTAYAGGWPYSMYQAPQQPVYHQPTYASTYPGYYPAPVHQPPPGGSNTVHGTYRSFRWQQPYAGPKTNTDSIAPSAPSPMPVSSHGDTTAMIPPAPHLPS